MVYIFDSKFDRYQATKIYKIISSGALERHSATRIINALKVKGVGYRRKEMLHDIRRAGAIEFCKTPETKLTSGYFFDYTYEPFREEHDLTASQTTQIFDKWEKDTWETPEELDLIRDIADRYEKIQDLL